MKHDFFLTTHEKPVTVNRLYGSNSVGRRFLVKQAEAFKNAVGWEAKQLMGSRELFHEPIEVQLVFYYADKIKRDIDNPVKVLLDALTKICFKDDSEIVKLIVEKKYDKDHPRIEIIINQL